MKILYNSFIFILHFGIYIASFFNTKARKIIEGHKNIFFRLQNTIDPNQPIIWFHTASTGEFEQGRPLIEALKKEYPHYKILLTFFSPSGYEAKKNYSGSDYIFYIPFDYSWNAKKFIDIIKPKAVFFIKYEFWYNYISYAHKKNIPLFSVSAIFRPSQIFFKWYGCGYRKVLNYFTYFFVQNNSSKELLFKKGIYNVIVGGDTRFDRVYEILQKTKKLPLIENFSEKAQVIVCGSTWTEDEKLLSDFFNSYKDIHRNLKMIIVPHEVDNQAMLNRLEQSFHLPAIRYSKIKSIEEIENFRILIVDVIGILSSVYKYGTIAYVGGGFGKGIHNILEAAVYEIPIVFGPKYKKFQEAIDLVDRKAAFSIKNYEQLCAIFETHLTQHSLLMQSGNIAAEYIKENLGATNRIFNYLKESKILENSCRESILV